MTEAARALGSDTAAISFHKDHRWIPTYVHGFLKDAIGMEMSDEREPHAVLALKTGKPVAIDDAFDDDPEKARQAGISEFLTRPKELAETVRRVLDRR